MTEAAPPELLRLQSPLLIPALLNHPGGSRRAPGLCPPVPFRGAGREVGTPELDIPTPRSPRGYAAALGSEQRPVLAFPFVAPRCLPSGVIRLSVFFSILLFVHLFICLLSLSCERVTWGPLEGTRSAARSIPSAVPHF